MDLKQDLLEFYREGIKSTISSALKLKKVQDRSKLINSKMKSLLLEKLEVIDDKNLDEILMSHYTNYIVMLESRNIVWPYEFMSFSRRIGELWEPFCKLPFEYSLNHVKFYTPPTYDGFRNDLNNDLKQFISSLGLKDEQIIKLYQKIDRLFELSESGAINLKEDLHFEYEKIKYVVDYKSGFSSNEKGNTNRLLHVAKIYSMIGGHECLVFVRQREEENNHYLQTLKNSGLWKVYCSTDAYNKIFEITGVNLREWMDSNMDWKSDISSEFREYLEQQELIQYLTW